MALCALLKTNLPFCLLDLKNIQNFGSVQNRSCAKGAIFALEKLRICGKRKNMGDWVAVVLLAVW